MSILKILKTTCAITLVAISISGCAKNNVHLPQYSAGSTVGKVSSGVIISARQVAIEDKSNGIGMGTGVGALAGGVIGNQLTGRSFAGTAMGAVLGGVAGNYIENANTSNLAMEYVVRIENNTPQNTQKNKNYTSHHTTEIKHKVRHNSIEDEIKDSVTMNSNTSDTIAVVQPMDTVFAIGQRVSIIYTNDSVKLSPRY